MVVLTGASMLALTAPAVAAPQADLSISQTETPAQVSPESEITYHITTTNNGPEAAVATKTLDTLPVDTSLLSLTQNSGPANGQTLPVGATETFTLTLHVGSAPRGTELVDVAEVLSTTPDPNSANNTAILDAYVTEPADVAITSTGPASVVAGAGAAYLLTVENKGPNAAQAITLTNPIPAGTTFVSLAQTEGPPFACATPAVGMGGTARCFGEGLASGAKAGFSLLVQTAANLPGGSMVLNTATVTADPTRNLDSGVDDDGTTVSTKVSGPLLTSTPGPSLPVSPSPHGLPAPIVTIRGLPATIRLKTLMKKGLTFTESANEATAFANNLLGRVQSASLSRVLASGFNLTLAHSSLALATTARTVKLKPNRRLIGRARKFRLELTVTATDASANSTTLTRTIRVR
jgi:uncharacterized repeat protein (TIGR01451 family)